MRLDPGQERASSYLRGLMAIGPGIVVVGSVMGAGELINTPVQAAKFGFVLLWAVLLACVIKLFLQVEIARHCLVHSRTTIEALNQCPGPKFRGTSWTALLYLIGYFGTMLTVLGIIGALGGLLHSLWPIAGSAEESARAWGAIAVATAAALLWSGVYRHLEIAVAIMVGVFSLSALAGLVMLQGTELQVTSEEFYSGLTFSLGGDRRAAGFAVISLMGALGVTSNELFMYPYWILEKGYARGLEDPASEGWTDRARNQIRALWLDATMSTALATFVTAAFFILGAAVLYRQNSVPTGLGVIGQISSVFTASYGNWSYYLFMVGAFCTLFSTLVVVAAASGRMWCDMLCSLGYLRRDDPSMIRRCHRVVQLVWLGGLLMAYLAVESAPVEMVLVGQFFAGAFMTPLLVWCICWLAFRTDARVRMSRQSALALLLSAMIITTCVLLGLCVS